MQVREAKVRTGMYNEGKGLEHEAEEGGEEGLRKLRWRLESEG